MSIYWRVVTFNFLRFLTYPLDSASVFIRRGIEIFFLMLFWSVVAKSSGGAINMNNILAYFLIATAIDVIIDGVRMNFARHINNVIKEGTMSNYLIKPMSIIPTIYATYIGQNGLNVMMAIITLIAGIMILPEISIYSYYLFSSFVLVAIFLAFSTNLLIGLLAFYTTEARTLRFSANHIIRLMSGLLIPISFFPDKFKDIILLTPFPGLIFGPTAVLTGQATTKDSIISLLVTIIWTVILLPLSIWLWNNAMRNYDAIGI